MAPIVAFAAFRHGAEVPIAPFRHAPDVPGPAFTHAAVPATALPRARAVAAGWPSCSATMAAHRVRTGMRFTRMGSDCTMAPNLFRHRGEPKRQDRTQSRSPSDR